MPDVHPFADLALILAGAALVGMGSAWAGLIAGRTTWLAVGIPALILAGITIFKFPQEEGAATLPEWAFAASAALLAGVATATIAWGAVGDAALGLIGLFFAGAAGLATGGWSNLQNEFTIESLGMLIAAVAGGFVFISALILPRQAPFRLAVGWLLVIAGTSVTFLGFAPSLSISL